MNKLLAYLQSIKILLPLLLTILYCSSGQNKDPNDLNDFIYTCAFEPELEELIFHAIDIEREGQIDSALEIYNHILSIRPNCIDVHQNASIAYAKLNNLKMMKYHTNKADAIRLSRGIGLVNNSPRSAKQEKVILKKEPPKRDKINYWKWMYIYSILRK